MELTFTNTDLARLCSSGARLVAHWGTDAIDHVGRRLLEVAALDADELSTLPGYRSWAEVDGSSVIDFDDGDVVLGGVAIDDTGLTTDLGKATGFRISRVEVRQRKGAE